MKADIYAAHCCATCRSVLRTMDGTVDACDHAAQAGAAVAPWQVCGYYYPDDTGIDAHPKAKTAPVGPSFWPSEAEYHFLRGALVAQALAVRDSYDQDASPGPDDCVVDVGLLTDLLQMILAPGAWLKENQL